MNILIKNWLDMCIGAMVYWAVGFAITFGKSRPGIAYFMGTSYYFFHEMPREYHIFCMCEIVDHTGKCDGNLTPARQSQLQPTAQLYVNLSPFSLSLMPCSFQWDCTSE